MSQSKQPSPFDRIFDAARRQLNAAQAAAVNHIEGPTLVVAGPGTGKTQLLAMRVGAILTETDAQPHNILCLTFTDAAVRAMRERLLTLIGAEAHKVRIYTFHSFCNRVIQDNLDLFGRQELSPLDELERRQILRDVLDELAPEHPLRRGHGSDVYFYEKHVIDLFRLMKTEAWTPPSVMEAAEAHVRGLPQNIDFQYRVTKKGLFEKGDLKREAIAEETERMERLKAAAQLHYRFEHLKRAAQRYDFDDMILWVSEAFEKFPFLLRGLQEQFLYFLVDEFQDTNGAQNRILQQLIGFWQQPNVLIVGDDDQAIYEFQGARLRSLVDFYDTYRFNVKLVLLTENYRSSQTILDTAKRLIDHNQLRILNAVSTLENAENGIAQLTKNLNAVGQNAEISTAPKVVEYASRPHEVAAVVAAIEQIFESHRLQNIENQQDTPIKPTLGVTSSHAESTITNHQLPITNHQSPPSVAIIFARHRSAEAYLRLLEKKRMPYTIRRAVNVLDAPLIQNLRLLLTYVALENRQAFSGEHVVFELLNVAFLGIESSDILNLAARLSRKRIEIETGSAITALTWRETLNQLPSMKYANKEKLQQLATHLETWIRSVNNEALTLFLEKIINQSGLLSWVLNDSERVKNTQIVNIFIEFVRREVEKRPRLHLADLLKTLDVMDANGLRLDWVRQDLNVDEKGNITEGVFLTTAHGAKGLEFDYVFVVDAVESEWEEARAASSHRFKLPPTLTFTVEADATEARRRLFYVAATRAKTDLHISYAQTDALGKPLSMSQFISELNLQNIETAIYKRFKFQNPTCSTRNGEL
jgi:DNA helicase II / ATP-dependent DNA helicase PcrA